MVKIRSKGLFNVWVMIFGFMLLLPVLNGCGVSDNYFPDDESVIQVCNWDANEYRVKLHHSTDNTVADEFTLDKWYEIEDMCDLFEDVREGYYYITIHEDNQSEPTDTSAIFFKDENDHEEFWIDDTGDINHSDD